VTDNPNPVDVHVGGRLRLRRTLLGKTQTDLGNAVGLTFQQIQKYERGANRIGSGRLYDFSQLLGVPVSFFYDDLPGEITEKKPTPDGQLFDQEQLSSRESLKLIRAYYNISNSGIRNGLYELARSLADKPEPKD
jgi:transcriptional regulator with XRE-family HTH domain